jgi:preprotein translocase subunit SecE
MKKETKNTILSVLGVVIIVLLIYGIIRAVMN